MTPRETFKQAWRELRANGRIGYQVLNAPLMRDAAVQSLRMRLDQDALVLARTRRTYALMDLHLGMPDAPAIVQLAPVFHPERPVLRLPMFKARVRKLLEAQPDGTALALRFGFLALDPEVGLVMYGPGESLDDAMDIDESCWDDEIGAWDGEMHADTWRYLSAPAFDYTHVRFES